jgi:hypothetical protein
VGRKTLEDESFFLASLVEQGVARMISVCC